MITIFIWIDRLIDWVKNRFGAGSWQTVYGTNKRNNMRLNLGSFRCKEMDDLDAVMERVAPDGDFDEESPLAGIVEDVSIYKIYQATDGTRYQYLGSAAVALDGSIPVSQLWPGEIFVSPGLIYAERHGRG
jgi:hypothetical protein